MYLRVSPDGKLVQSEEITVPGPTMMHDFAASEKHALFLDLPVVFSLEEALKGKACPSTGATTTRRASASCRAPGGNAT